MRLARRCLGLASIVVAVSLSWAGCAPAYHDYADCYIDCQYCAPPPLPYVHYEGCVCHACVATKYLQGAAAPAEDTTPADGAPAPPRVAPE